jgi:hypothetical protein
MNTLLLAYPKLSLSLSHIPPQTHTHTLTASLLIHHPLLLSCPLSSETVEVAQEAMKVGLTSRWLAKSLSYNMVSYNVVLERVVYTYLRVTIFCGY